MVITGSIDFEKAPCVVRANEICNYVCMYITHSGRAGMFVCYTAVCCSTKFVVAGTQNPMVIYCFIKSFYYQK